MEAVSGEGVRLDKWLWAARWFKTRSVSADACVAGHVKLNGSAAKPAKAVRIGDRLEVRSGEVVRQLEVVALSEKRGPASVARELYLDHTPPPPPKDPGVPEFRQRGAGRPSKRDQRLIRKLRGY